MIAMRRAVQTGVLLLLLLIPFLNRKGILLVSGSLYSLSIGPIWITDPMTGLQPILTRLVIDAALLISMLIPIIIALCLGRVFCGWICPQNLISELADSLAIKLGIRRFSPRNRLYPRYAVFAGIVIVIVLTGMPAASYLSAPGIISVQPTRFATKSGMGLELVLIGMIVITELFLVRRVWCNHLCPIGGLLGLFRFKRTLKIVFTEDAEHVCGRCRACVNACRLGLDPMQGDIYPFCHNCGDCVSACKGMNRGRPPLTFKFL